jgi:hypothetical protein
MDRVVSDLRGELFGRFACVSALALPSLVPLRVWPTVGTLEEEARVLAGAAVAASFTLQGYIRHAGYCYLSVECPSLPLLRDRIETAAPGGAEPPLVPPYPGFLLAGADLAVSVEDLARLVPLPAEARFSSYGLSIYTIEVQAPLERWWDHVSWVEEVHVPVKRSGRAAPGSAAG